MKKTVKFLALLMAFVFAASPLFFENPVSAAEGGAAEIPGIDYSRITQKADGGKRNYAVELKLGDVTFNGELVGETGLTIEELNAIIRQMLAEMDLTPERVALVKKIAERVETDAKLYWGDQVASGLLSYLQIPIPGSIFSVGDYYEYVVHKDTGSAELSAKKEAVQTVAKKGLESAAKAGGRIGRVAKGTAGALGEIPLLGQIVNTAIVANGWLDGNKRFDDYLELLEENLAVINNFYSACSRRAVAVAESRDAGNTWKIKFDKRKNRRTYKCTFWGIAGNEMSCSLGGELVSADNGVTGSYTGTLWLEFESVDLSAVGANAENTSGLKPVLSLLYSTGGYKKSVDTGGTVVLKCESQGKLTFYVSEAKGDVTPNVVGSLANEKEITFSFDRHLEWVNEQYASLGSHGFTEADLSSSDIDSVRMKTFSKVYSDNGVVDSRRSDESYPQDRGTVLAPLESDPVIIIHFS